MSWQRRIVGTGEVLTLLYSAALALAGIVWLILSTQLSVIQESWLMLLMLAALMIIFRKLGFFYITEIRAGRYASSDGSMEGMVLWVALLLFGPTTLWLAVLFSTIDFVRSWRHLTSTLDRWNRGAQLLCLLGNQKLLEEYCNLPPQN